MNCLSFAAKNGVRTDDTILFTSMIPCTDCAKMIIQCGIKEIYYYMDYEFNSSKELLLKNNINIYKIDKEK